MSLDLSGTWRALLADDEIRRSGLGLDVDDSGWEPIRVPGHWATTPALADSNGPVLYRTRFEFDRPAPGSRSWVVLDGIFYQGDVWLDGAYLGDPEGYCFPHAFDITDLARLGSEHVLAVEVTCSPQRDRRAKRNLTGAFQHSDLIDPDWNPGGLWRPVRIETTGPVRFETLRVLTRDLSEERANVILRAQLDSDAARTATLRTLVDGQLVATQARALATGTNAVEWNVDIDNPRIWWPWALGDQPMTEITVEVVADGTSSDRRRVRTGLREVAFEDWTLSVNGERLFVKGVNVAPTRAALGDASAAEIRRDVELARDAGLDLLRVHGHVGRQELYDAADELGMLVWQDFPMHGGYARLVRGQAVHQAERIVDELGHHPSIAVWCGHDEPFRVPASVDEGFELPAVRRRYALAQQLPSWNRTILDRWVRRAFERADETRRTVTHSGVWPHLPQLNGTDSHLYFGWRHGTTEDLAELAARIPRLVRFVSEFGAQAVPTTADFLEPDRWPDLDWEHLEAHHGLQKELLDRHVPSAAYRTFDRWQQATQAFQAELLRRQIETLRRLKYGPTGGFCAFVLADAQPAVSCAMLDHERVPKAGFTAVTEACRPVIVVADHLSPQVAQGAAVALDIHVVSDLRVALEDAEVSVHLQWEGGDHRWRFGGTVPADSCERVGTVRFVVPKVVGEIVVDLVLEAGDVAATNRYRAAVVPTA